MPNTRADELIHIASLMLRPLLRLFVHYGVGLADVIESIKRIYIEVAQEKLAQENKKATDSSLSVMTGVHRKDVRRILNDHASGQKKRHQRFRSVLERALMIWTGTERYTTKKGTPRTLPRRKYGARATASEAPTFEDLVEEVTKGVSPRALLDEWIRLGAVRLNSRGEVVYGVPEVVGLDADRMMRLMIVCSDRFTASLENQLLGQKKNFVRFIYGAHLEEAEARKLEIFAGKQMEVLNQRINARVIDAEERGKKSGGTYRFSFGMHCLVEPMQALEQRGFKMW